MPRLPWHPLVDSPSCLVAALVELLYLRALGAFRYLLLFVFLFSLLLLFFFFFYLLLVLANLLFPSSAPFHILVFL